MIRTFAPSVRLGPSIGEDHVLTVVRDADGVESVVLYRITKRGP
jgi:hypothetical protein